MGLTLAGPLAELFTGSESWAFWCWRYPSFARRLRAVSPSVDSYGWHSPKVDLTHEDVLTATVVSALEGLDTGFYGIVKLKQPQLDTGPHWAAWRVHYLGKPAPTQGFGSPKYSASTIKAALVQVRELEHVSFALMLDRLFGGAPLAAPVYSPPSGLSIGTKSILSSAQLGNIGKAWTTAQHSRRLVAQTSPTFLANDGALGPEAARYGEPQRLLEEASDVALSGIPIPEKRAAFDMILEEAHAAGPWELIPALYELAWSVQSSAPFPGLHSSWDAARAKAKALAADKKAIEAWVYTVAFAAGKSYRACSPEWLNLGSAIPPYRVRYKFDWWTKGLPWVSLDVKPGDGGAGKDLRLPLYEFNMDSLEPDVGDFVFSIGFGLASAIVAGGLASSLSTSIGSTLGFEASGVFGSALEEGLAAAGKTGASGLAGGDASIGSAFLSAAGSSLLENPMSVFDSLSLGGVQAGLDKLAGIAKTAGDIADTVSSIKGALDGASKTDVLPSGAGPSGGGAALSTLDPSTPSGQGKTGGGTAAGVGMLAAAAVLLLLLARR